MLHTIINAVKRCYTLLVSFVSNTVSILFNLPSYLLDLARKATTAAFESLMQVRILFGTTLFVIAGSASAAIPAAVTTAITDGVADVTTIGGSILAVVVAIVGFGWLRRIIK